MSITSTPRAAPQQRGLVTFGRYDAACPEWLWDCTAVPPLNKQGEQPPLRLGCLGRHRDVLSRRYKDDRHFCTYMVVGPTGHPVPRHPRIQKCQLELVRARGFQVLHGTRAADVDTPRHQPITAEQCEAIRAALAFYPCILFFSRAGARVIQPLTRLLTPEQYEGSVTRWLAELQRLLPGFVVDTTCTDWTRLFRLAHVVRDGTPTECVIYGLDTDCQDPGDTTPLVKPPPIPSVSDVLCTDTPLGLITLERYALQLIHCEAGHGYQTLRAIATKLGRYHAGGAITAETCFTVLENAIADWDVPDHSVYLAAVADCFEFGVSRGPWPDATIRIDERASALRSLEALGIGGFDCDD